MTRITTASLVLMIAALLGGCSLGSSAARQTPVVNQAAQEQTQESPNQPVVPAPISVGDALSALVVSR